MVGGIFLLIATMVIGMIMGALFGYDPTSLPGVRSVNDPIMWLFFLQPFVMAGAASIVFEMVKTVLKGNAQQKAIQFGWLLFVVVAIPSLFLLITSMNYPIAFYIDNILYQIIGFIGLGKILVKMDG